MGKNGGVRPGAGRPRAPHTIETEATKKAIVERVNAEAKELMDAWLDVAKGHFVYVKTASGETKVYKRPPNSTAIKDIIERAHGKPKQDVDVTSNGETITFASSPAIAAITEEYEGKLRDVLIDE